MTTLQIGGGAGKSAKRTVISLAASGIVQAAVPGKRLKYFVYSIQSRNDGMSVQFTDGNGGTNLAHVWTLNAREGAAPPAVHPLAFIFATSAGTALYAVVSGAGTVDIDGTYWDDDAA